MISCKKCESEKYEKMEKLDGNRDIYVKHGGCNFIEGDRRTNEKIKAGKAMCRL